jgi:predicted transcriptional regulator
MPQFEEIARLPVSSLVSDQDIAATVQPTTTLQALAGDVANATGHAVVVAENDEIKGLVTAADVAKALNRGVSPDTQIGGILDTLEGANPVVIDAAAPLAHVPDLLGNKSMVVVKDAAGTVHMVKRDELAQRIRDRFG